MSGRAAGGWIITASWGGTAALAVSAGLATVVPDAGLVALVVALALFVAGTIAFVAALVTAAARSRAEALTMAGLFFLEGAPKKPRRLLLGSLVAEVAVAFVTAGIRPNTSLAFGMLAPVYGQALAGLWGVRHGNFPSRGADPGPRRRVAGDARPRP